MLVDKLEMQLVRGAGDDTHGDLLRLAPASELGRVGRSERVADHASRACCAHENADVVVGREVCLEGGLPLHVVFSREHRQVPVARESASGIVRHSGGDDGSDGGTRGLCRRRRCREAHNLYKSSRR